MSKLSVHERALLLLRVATVSLVLALILVLTIRVSAAQRPNAPVTIEDARQDDRLDDLQTWRENLENYNKEEGQKVQDLSEDLSAIRGIGIGAMSVLGILQAVQVILQLKKKP